MANTIDLEFADGTYTFALPVEHINELQIKCGTGIGGLFRRVFVGRVEYDGKSIGSPFDADFHLLDIVETIRHGLIGGGTGIVNGEEIKVTPAIANRLIATYVLPRPLVESWDIAAAILGACVVGYDPPKKAEPASKPATGKTKTAA